MSKRKKIATFLILPVVTFVTLIGWCLTWIGATKADSQINKPSIKLALIKGWRAFRLFE